MGSTLSIREANAARTTGSETAGSSPSPMAPRSSRRHGKVSVPQHGIRPECFCAFRPVGLRSASQEVRQRSANPLFVVSIPNRSLIPRVLNFVLDPLIGVRPPMGPRARLVLTDALVSARGMLVRLRNGERTVREASINGPANPITAGPLHAFLWVHQELATPPGTRWR